MDVSKKDKVPAIPPAIGQATADGIMTIVELGQVKYHIHKALLVFHSEYFCKALQGPWKEAEEGIVRLDDVGTVEFNIFVHWLYAQQLPTSAHEIARICGKECDTKLNLGLVKAYSLGDRLLALKFRRAENNLIVGPDAEIYVDLRASVPAIKWAFENISSERPLLQFLVNFLCDRWCAEYDDSGDVEKLHQLPPSFMVRAMIRFSFLRDIHVNGCFMEHTNEEKKRCRKGMHPEYKDGHCGYGYTGELDQ